MKHRPSLNRSAGLRSGAIRIGERAGSETGSPQWRHFWPIGLAALIGLSAGCTNVQPWERDALAHYSMRPDRDPVTLTLREHMWFSREAANGGRSVGGGGCGCN